MGSTDYNSHELLNSTTYRMLVEWSQDLEFWICIVLKEIKSVINNQALANKFWGMKREMKRTHKLSELQINNDCCACAVIKKDRKD